MPSVFINPHRGSDILPDVPNPVATAAGVGKLLSLCPAYAPTPLISADDLAQECGVAALWLKDERQRMGLGSFKALGAAFVIARDASKNVDGDNWDSALRGRRYIAASAGNHGLSVAAGARLFGATAVIYLSDTVPEAFAERLRKKGAEVVRAGATYEESMDAALNAANNGDGLLLSDSSWDGYFDPPLGVMEGYVQLAHEATEQTPDVPTHILLQAGVGGLAAAVAALARAVWKDTPKIIVVEPEAAPALIESAREGRAVTAAGPVSVMGRLDCKTPSLIALKGLARDADVFVTISEDEAKNGATRLARAGFNTTPSGGAGVAALIAGLPEIPANARVLAILSEGAEGG